jgi:MFS family permease
VTAIASPSDREARAPLAAIAPIAGVVFTAFFVIGLALPVLPLHVHDDLGMGAFVVGLVAGCQFAASLVSRLWAGRITDTQGPKRAVLLGLSAAVGGGACYLLSLLLTQAPEISVGILLAGRTLVGGAESLIITGGMLWGLGRVAPDRSAQVIAWVGMSMFAAMAIGAPIGSLIFSKFGFFGIALASTLVPLISIAFIAPIRLLAPVTSAKAPVSAVLGAVLLPGVGFALSGITFGSVTAFLTLYFAVEGWAGGALAFTTFAVALIATRVVAGHLPDQFGGAQVALYCLVIQALGLTLIGTADTKWIATLGAAVAGAGFSLVFPGLGLEAVRRVPPANRGIAMGAYNAFLDLTLGVGSPLLGLLAGRAGIASVFDASAIAAILAVPIALRLRAETSRSAMVGTTPQTQKL